MDTGEEIDLVATLPMSFGETIIMKPVNYAFKAQNS